MSIARERATDLLAHYFRVAFQAAGQSWDSDNYAEIEQAVDLIGDMVAEEVAAQLANRGDESAETEVEPMGETTT